MVVVLALLLVAAAAPGPLSCAALLSASTTDPTAPLLGVVGLAAWGCAAWLLLVLLLSALSVVPHAVGRVARAVLCRVAPAAVRRLCAVLLGVGLAAGAGTATAAPTGPTPVPSAVGSAAPWLDWPVAPGAEAGPSTGTSTSPTPDLGEGVSPQAPRSTGPTADQTGASQTGSGQPGGPGTGRSSAGSPGAAPRATTSPTGADPAASALAAGSSVVVQPGDCLWDLAARELGPRASALAVAQAWPSWWSANRAVIGDDPGLLHPGQRLVRPTPPDP